MLFRSSGRQGEVDSDQIKTLTENNQRYTMWEIADILKISKSSVENCLHQLGCINCFDVWVSHKLNKRNLLDRISTCDFLLKRNKNVPFLKQIVMGSEKWILYNAVEWKRTTTNHTKGWSSSKEGDVVYMVGLEGSRLL